MKLAKIPLLRFLILAVLSPAIIISAAQESWAQDGIADAPLVAGVEGVPLMPGLAEAPDLTVIFDKPQGRIIDATAFGNVGLAEAYAYYRSALAETGWAPLLRKVVDGILVVRGEEVLHVRLRREGPGIAVHFSLSPYEKE